MFVKDYNEVTLPVCYQCHTFMTSINKFDSVDNERERCKDLYEIVECPICGARTNILISSIRYMVDTNI